MTALGIVALLAFPFGAGYLVAWLTLPAWTVGCRRRRRKRAAPVVDALLAQLHAEGCTGEGIPPLGNCACGLLARLPPVRDALATIAAERDAFAALLDQRETAPAPVEAQPASASEVAPAVVEERPRPPAKACPCGKPIVFVGDARRASCSRCGRRWVLRMEIVAEDGAKGDE